MVVYAQTYTAAGDLHSEIPVCFCTETEATRVLTLLRGRRTVWERHGQRKPSFFIALDPEETPAHEYVAWVTRYFLKGVAKLPGVGSKTIARLWDENNQLKGNHALPCR